MRSKAACLSFAALLSSAPAAALPAFPGAEGFGAKATGGRGGRVIKVTTLASSGPGSLSAALSQTGPRIVVFGVSGVIEGDAVIESGDVTIAGQTAPGGGITIHGRLVADYDFAVKNIIVRHVRVRPRPLTSSDTGGEQYDAIQFSRNGPVILDHVSVAWGSDETIDLYEASDVTVQWSTIEASGTEGHPEGRHNYGIISGPDAHRFSFHHNLCAHHQNRCPAVANGPADVINNVVYDVRHGFVHHNPATGEFHLVGNYFRRGPSAELFPFFFDDEDQPGDEAYFLRDNFVDDPPQIERSVDDIWATPFAHESFENAGGQASRVTSSADFGAADPGYVAVTQQASAAAYPLVLEHAGACPRDVVTRGTVADVRARNGSWGASEPDDLMAGLAPGSAPADADGDGMADAWESAHGLDARNGADHATVRPSGYTAIEEYVNELADQCGGVPPGDGGATGGRGGAGGAGAAGGVGASSGAGAAGGSGGTGGAVDGGAAGASGSAATAGAGASNAAESPSDDGGCGCALPTGDATSKLALLVALGVIAAMLRGHTRVTRR